MPIRERSRNIEGLLSLCTLLLLIPTLFLAYRGKQVRLPEETINVNEMSAKQLVVRGGMGREGANNLVAHRREKGGFESVDAALRAAKVSPQEARTLEIRLVARTGSTVFWHYTIGCVLFVLLLFLVPPMLRASIGGGDPYLLPLSLLLTAFGVVQLFCLKDPLRDGPAYEHHLLGMVPALLALVLASRLSLSARQRIRNYQYLWVFAAVGLVVALSLFGRGPEGVKLNLLGFQPVEIIKMLLVFFLAGYLSDRATLIADKTPRKPKAKIQNPKWADIGPMLVMYGFALTLFLVVKDLGPGLLLFTTFLTVLYLTTGRSGFVWSGLALLLLGGLLGYMRHIGVFATRVDMWLHPFANSHPNGMQLGQALWGMATGGWEGSGLGMGMTATLPRGGSDLAFASWAEETGIIGVWLLLTLYAVLFWRGLHIALRANTDFDRALAFGLSALLGLQALIILAGVTGLIPLTGISLPFMAYGNSALVANFAAIGLLRGISVPPRGGVGRPAPRGEVLVATRRCAACITLLLLGVIGIVRMGWMQVLAADSIAVHPITTPDADKVLRPHINPRLLAVAYAIERGSIYDSAGRVLATSRPAELTKLIREPRLLQQMLSARTRYYPFGPAFAHLVGYLDPAVGGPFGFEKGYDADLRGYQNPTELLPDYRRRNLPGYEPRRGRDLHLTIDAALQRDIQALLLKTALTLKDKETGKTKDRAAFVLLSPQTGDVLAAVTTPTFDPNGLTPEQMHTLLAKPDANLEALFINRSVNGLYPPGSTFKVATAAIALDQLADIGTFSVACNQVYPEIHWQANSTTYVRRNVRDDKGDPRFGNLTLAPAFRVSSNIFFANLAVEIGANTFRSMLTDRMQFRHVPSQKAFDADLPDIGYGQGRMLASPLEMARLTAAVANEGRMRKPRFVTSLTDPAGKEKKRIIEAEMLRTAMKPETSKAVRDMMRTVVLRGTASGVFSSLTMPVAGKTGTAQNEQADKEPHSWFVGMAPYAETPGITPRYAFACVVENGGYGKRVAAVVCREVLKRLEKR